ncbi:DinB family protein [Candidatus Daviesbacteria bacterium]|nr:DinB family protein [Candidatus Daviesbacteria bacterium]
MLARSKTKKGLKVKEILSNLENLWEGLDKLLSSISPNDWQKKHGKDWIMADVPYHLSYFDKGLVYFALKKGKKYPKKKQVVMKTMRQLNNWNAFMFKMRPKKQSVEKSLRQMRQSRNLIRKVLEKMKDSNLKDKVFVPLPGMGWISAEEALLGLIGHTWNLLMQLRIHLKRNEPLPLPSVTKKALGMYMELMGMFLNKSEALKIKEFRAIFDFVGEYNGVFSIKVKNDQFEVVERKVNNPNLVMSQSIETFVKTINNIQSPFLAMLLGRIKVKGFFSLNKFAKLFPEPFPNTIIPSKEIPT